MNTDTNSKDTKSSEIKRLGRMDKDTGRTTIYVGNLNYKTTEYDIKKMFHEYGPVSYVEVSNKVRGTAFIQMKHRKHADAAIKVINGSEVDGRTLKASIAKERAVAVRPIKRIVEAKAVEAKEVKNSKVKTPKVAEAVKMPRRKKKESGLTALFDYLGK